LTAIDITALFGQHADAASVSGLPLFLLFLVLNAMVMGAAILIVKRTLGEGSNRGGAGAAEV
jgi:hypothetical protein